MSEGRRHGLLFNLKSLSPVLVARVTLVQEFHSIPHSARFERPSDIQGPALTSSGLGCHSRQGENAETLKRVCEHDDMTIQTLLLDDIENDTSETVKWGLATKNLNYVKALIIKLTDFHIEKVSSGSMLRTQTLLAASQIQDSTAIAISLPRRSWTIKLF
ncbi:hypothetical protein WG66_003775 [Moniliophthora roreri]|nr:hypothetical protein WG66_003775 [Moniliophthora roreri]